jgi:hypothetical protein
MGFPANSNDWYYLLNNIRLNTAVNMILTYVINLNSSSKESIWNIRDILATREHMIGVDGIVVVCSYIAALNITMAITINLGC